MPRPTGLAMRRSARSTPIAHTLCPRTTRLNRFVAHILALLLLVVGLGRGGPFAPAYASDTASGTAAKPIPVRPYVYATASSPTSYDIMLADGSSKDRMVTRVKVDGIYFGDVSARLAADAGMLAFRVSGDRSGGSSLYAVDIKTTKYTQLALFKGSSGGIGGYVWSPAGRTLAFVRTSPAPDPTNADDAYGDVWIYSAGFQPVKLGGTHGNDSVLGFSGDGLGVYVDRREVAAGVTLEHLVYLPVSGGEETVIVKSQPDLKYTGYALLATPGQPAKVAALTEGNFSLALAGTVPYEPPPATPTPVTAGRTSVTSAISAAAAALSAAVAHRSSTRVAPRSKVPVDGKLSRPGSLGLVVFDPVSAVPSLLRRDAEAYPYIDWTPDGKGLLMGGARTGTAWDVDLDGNRRGLGTPLTGLSASTWSADGSLVVLSDAPTTRLVTLDYNAGKEIASRALGYSKVGTAAVSLRVPYIHQVNDTAANADGNWACGPTSVAMALAYYGKIEPWQNTIHNLVGGAVATPPAQQPAQQPPIPPTPTRPPIGTDFAPYVTTAYSYNGHTYSATAADPRGRQLAGLYGTICPTGLASWDAMQSVLQWHGLNSNSVPVSWDGIVGALKRGHPVLLGNMLTSQGHIILVTGYTADGNLVANDPYGNRFAPGYGSNNGQSVVYPWKRITPRTAVEIIGVWPPPTATPTITPTRTATPTYTATQTRTATAIYTVTPASTAAAVETPTP